MTEWLFNLRRRLCRWLMEAWFSTPFIHGDKDRLILGKRVSRANTLFNTRSGRIVIGDGVIFGHNCMVLTGRHDLSLRGSQERRHTQENAEDNDILIESGCWIGSGCNIIGGVKIGKDSVIGAGSVVVKDIPSEVLAAGNPCKVIRKLEYPVNQTGKL